MLLFKAKLLHIKVLFLQQQWIKKRFWGWCFFCFAALPKQYWLPGMAQHSPCWDVIALCWSMKVVYGGTGRHRGRDRGSHSQEPQWYRASPCLKAHLCACPWPGLVCLWCLSIGWGALWTGGVPKARAQLPAWGWATVSWSALGLACLKTSSWVFPVLCTGQLFQFGAFLVKMLLISAAELHGGKRSLKTAHVCRREGLKGGEKELLWGSAWTLRQGSFTCYSPQAWLVLCWLPLLFPHPRLLRGFQFANKACVMLGAAVLSTAIHGAVRSSQFEQAVKLRQGCFDILYAGLCVMYPREYPEAMEALLPLLSLYRRSGTHWEQLLQVASSTSGVNWPII